MSIFSSILGTVLGTAFPQFAPVLGAIQSAAEFIERNKEAVDKVVDAGQSVFDVIKEKAPGLVEAVKRLAKADPNSSRVTALENAARAMLGYHRMTPDEERRWMDNYNGQQFEQRP